MSGISIFNWFWWTATATPINEPTINAIDWTVRWLQIADWAQILAGMRCNCNCLEIVCRFEAARRERSWLMRWCICLGSWHVPSCCEFTIWMVCNQFGIPIDCIMFGWHNFVRSQDSSSCHRSSLCLFRLALIALHQHFCVKFTCPPMSLRRHVILISP